MTRLKKAGGGVAALTAAGLLSIQVIGNWEGLRLYAYQDVVGVWTKCYGDTKDVKPGMKFTKEQCDIWFIERLTEHEAGMRKCLVNPDIIPTKTYVSMLSLTYNIGTGAFCKSSIKIKWNAGQQVASCNAFLLYNRAGGRVLKGLVNRRKFERKLCIDGLDEPVTVEAPNA